jgi:hypothetical protein
VEGGGSIDCQRDCQKEGDFGYRVLYQDQDGAVDRFMRDGSNIIRGNSENELSLGS